MRHPLLPVLALLVATAPLARARAADADTGDAMTTIHLVQRVEHDIARDRLNATLRVEIKGLDPAQVQAEVNRRMQDALGLAKGVTAVKLAGGSYSVFRQPPTPPNDAAPDKWIASQTLAITSKDFAAALKLVGDLQSSGLVIQSLDFDVAPETLRAAQEGMSDEALNALRTRAQHVATTMNMAVDHYKTIDIGDVTTQNLRPPMPLRVMAANANAQAPSPAAEAGDATASLTVDAQVVLGAKK